MFPLSAVSHIHTHDAFIGDICVALQVKQHSHIVLIVGCIEPGYIDQGRSQTVPEILGIQRRLPIIGKVYGFSRVRRSLYILGVRGGGDIYERED